MTEILDRVLSTNEPIESPMAALATGRPDDPMSGGVPLAAVADCTCPEFCERDHTNE